MVVVVTDLFHMMDPSGAPQNVNFDEPVSTFDARYLIEKASDLTTLWEPLTNGDIANPELIFAGGDVIMVEVAL